jgi:hypothetical protein
MKRSLATVVAVLMLVVALAPAAMAKVTKVEICHYDAATDSYALTSVPEKAKVVAAHLAHGDGYPGDPVPTAPGYVFGADCALVPAGLRTVTLTFSVTVPTTTDSTTRSVYISGTLDLLDGGLPQGGSGVALTRVDATHWTITFTGDETTQLEYKYTLGDWDERDSGCAAIANRQLTLSYGATGIQAVNDVVANWQNVAPCGS